MKTINDIMDRLTALKAESVNEGHPFGRSAADKEIKAIDNTLQACGVKWCYTWDASGKWVAIVKR